MENEIWKDIEGFPNYSISNHGRIFSKKKKIFMKIFFHARYFSVGLFKNGIPKQKRFHRLLAKAFIPNPENKPFINHIDGNPKNNKLNNLEWCTGHENIKHAYKMRLIDKRGERHHLNKLTNEDVLLIRSYKNSTPKLFQKEIAKKFGIHQSTVSYIWSRKNWGHI